MIELRNVLGSIRENMALLAYFSRCFAVVDGYKSYLLWNDIKASIKWDGFINEIYEND